MTLKSRFLLIGIGITIFTLITPVVVLFALGYQFDWESKQIVKTASLIVNSEPRKADVLINGLKQRQQTNATIRFLLPGDYNIEVSKPGYQSWTKRLNFLQGLVTWANQDREYITLFYSNPVSKSEREFSLATLDIPGQNAVTVDEDLNLEIFDANSANSRALENRPGFPLPPELTKESTLYNYLRYPAVQVFNAEQLVAAEKVEGNDKYAAALLADELFQVKNGSITSLAVGVSGFILQDEHLWFVQANQLKRANLSLGLVENIAQLPYAPTKSEIIRGEGRVFLILDSTLYALNDEVEEITRGVEYAYWDSKTALLVYANDFEAFLFNPNRFESQLIIRSTTPIIQPVINGTTGYLFFMNEGKIKAIELDGRDHRNVYTIANGPAENFLIDDDGELLSIFTDTGLKVFEIR